MKNKLIDFPVTLSFDIGADFLGAMGANAPRENSPVGASHSEEFGPKIPI